MKFEPDGILSFPLMECPSTSLFHYLSFSIFLSDLACILQLGNNRVSVPFINKRKKEGENYRPITLLCNFSNFVAWSSTIPLLDSLMGYTNRLYEYKIGDSVLHRRKALLLIRTHK